MSASLLAIGLDEIEQAAQFIHRTVSPTPQYPWPKLRTRAGCTVWVKHENHTPTGAFKVRGGLLYLDRLLRAMPDVRGIVSATRMRSRTKKPTDSVVSSVTPPAYSKKSFVTRPTRARILTANPPRRRARSTRPASLRCV